MKNYWDLHDLWIFSGPKKANSLEFRKFFTRKRIEFLPGHNITFFNPSIFATWKCNLLCFKLRLFNLTEFISEIYIFIEISEVYIIKLQRYGIINWKITLEKRVRLDSISNISSSISNLQTAQVSISEILLCL